MMLHELVVAARRPAVSLALCVTRTSRADGTPSVEVGHRLLDDYLRFVAARARPTTLLAVAYDVRVFFRVVAKEPEQVTTGDVLAFIADQQQPRRGDNVVRLEDGEAGLSARKIKRRQSSLSGLFAYLVARDDVDVAANPVPRGLATGLDTVTCHMLRHTCLTPLREAGMALEAVQAQAGHRSIETTRIYLQLSNGWLAADTTRH